MPEEPITVDSVVEEFGHQFGCAVNTDYFSDDCTQITKRITARPQAYLEAWLRTKAQQLKAEGERTGKRKQGAKAVTLYQKALGDVKLPESVWKKIAKANELILDN